MIRFLFPFMVLISFQSYGNEVEDFLQSIPQPSMAEAISFIEKTADPLPNNEKKCSFNAPLSEFVSFREESKQKLLLFTSFSVPLESWKEHSIFLEKTGGYFVLQGLPQNSFTALAQKMVELRKAGIRAEILLDPESFEKYEIHVVPSLVLDKGEQHDKVSGNLKISTALSLFAERGNTQKVAQQLLKQAEAN